MSETPTLSEAPEDVSTQPMCPNNAGSQPVQLHSGVVIDVDEQLAAVNLESQSTRYSRFF